MEIGKKTEPNHRKSQQSINQCKKARSDSDPERDSDEKTFASLRLERGTSGRENNKIFPFLS